MESSAEEIGALYESVAFLNYFKDLPDVRQSGKVKYPLDEILLLCLLAVVAGAETITDIARFGRHNYYRTPLPATHCALGLCSLVSPKRNS